MAEIWKKSVCFIVYWISWGDCMMWCVFFNSGVYDLFWHLESQNNAETGTILSSQCSSCITAVDKWSKKKSCLFFSPPTSHPVERQEPLFQERKRRRSCEGYVYLLFGSHIHINTVFVIVYVHECVSHEEREKGKEPSPDLLDVCVSMCFHTCTCYTCDFLFVPHEERACVPEPEPYKRGFIDLDFLVISSNSQRRIKENRTSRVERQTRVERRCMTSVSVCNVHDWHETEIRTTDRRY